MCVVWCFCEPVVIFDVFTVSYESRLAYTIKHTLMPSKQEPRLMLLAALIIFIIPLLP